MTAIKSIGVLGAGELGESITYKLAEQGFGVVLVDVKPDLIEHAFESIRGKIDAAPRDSYAAAEETDIILSKITISTDPTFLKNTYFVFEAIPDDLELKKAALKNIAKICRDDTVFASSISSCRIGELAKEVPHPKRFLGMHFFSKHPKTPLVEIIKGADTSASAMQTCIKISRMLGCQKAICTDILGFLVKRMESALFNEAVRLLSEGQANIPTIDASAKSALSVSQGPFELMNILGINKAKVRADGLADLGNIYRLPQRLSVQAMSNEAWNIEGEIDEKAKSSIIGLFQGLAVLVGTELFQQKAARLEDIDTAMQFGLGWAKGPFGISNRIGVEKSLELVKAVAKMRSTDIPQALKDRTEMKTPWPYRYVDTDISEHIATVTINRVDATNAFNEQVIDQLKQTLDSLEADPEVTAIVFTGSGKSLECGFRPKKIAEKIEANEIEEIVAQFKKASNLLTRIASMEKTTITYADGLTLSGGVELGLASKIFVAGPKAVFAFPETGWGIHPGLGGTQRLPRKVGKSIGKYLILTGERLSAEAALRLGVVDILLEDEHTAEQIIKDIANDNNLMVDEGAPNEEELQKILLFNAQNSRSTLSGEIALDNAQAKHILDILKGKAPIALKLADKLIEDGLSLELDKALSFELASLELILGTKDALRGLESAGLKKPNFSGE